MKIAILTCVRDEEFFLPIWYRYYAKHFNKNDIYIIDNDSKIPLIDKYNNVIEEKSQYCFDHSFLRKTIYENIAKLLNKYDYVIYTDVDEILYLGYLDEILKTNKDVYYSVGYQVVTEKNDLEIDLTQPLLKQRSKYVKLSTFYKPVIQRMPQIHITDYKDALNGDERLKLIHLKTISLAEWEKRWKVELNYKWNPKDLQTTMGWQYRIKSRGEMYKKFYNIINATGELIDIPDYIRELI